MLLLDEPASGVNPTLLNTLRDFLRRIYDERQIVFLIVEHNMEFIMSLASHDRGDAPGPDPGAGHARRGAVRPARDRGLSRMSEALLSVRGLKAGYGDGRLIVDGVDLDVSAGEIVTMIGQNGAGKSTVLKGIYHMTRERHGECVSLGGSRCLTCRRMNLLRHGLAYIPQQHTVFPKLTIAENLTMGGYLIRDRRLVRRAHRGRRGDVSGAGRPPRRNMRASLSGGEQRMLEIARTLVMDPKVIMLDEPSIGLAPRIVDQVFAVVRRLAESGKAILMVEQNVKKALAASDRACVLELGRIRLQDRAQALIGDERVARLYMGVSGASSRRDYFPQIEDRLGLPAAAREQRIVRGGALHDRRHADRALHAPRQRRIEPVIGVGCRHDAKPQPVHRQRIVRVLLVDHGLEIEQRRLAADGIHQRLRIDQHALDLDQIIDAPRQADDALGARAAVRTRRARQPRHVAQRIAQHHGATPVEMCQQDQPLAAVGHRLFGLRIDRLEQELVRRRVVIAGAVGAFDQAALHLGRAIGHADPWRRRAERA